MPTLAIVLSLFALAFATPGGATNYVMPQITAAINSGPNEVTVTWSGVYGKDVILIQNGNDTLRPNTGRAVIFPAPATDRIQVCENGPNYNVCSPAVTVAVQ